MSARVTVDAPAGPIVGTAIDGVVRWLGIPFAEAPVGPLRFAAPQPRAPFDRPFDASRHGATPQRVPLFAKTTVPEPSIPGDDTLNLNVVAPEHRDRPLPVFVWVHGGGYVAGSQASPWYDGRSFARDDVVTVTMSYRLGIEGFAPLDGVPDNRGLLDVLLALEWVQRNIGAFGGDPARVTLGGQSAGGGVVLALLSSVRGRGLFRAAVSVSGVDLTMDRDHVARRLSALAAGIGVTPTAAGFGTLTEAELQSALAGARVDTDAVALGPVAGDDVLTVPVVEGLRVNNLDVPLLLGAAGDEFDGGPTPEDPDTVLLDPALRVAARLAGSRTTDTLFRAVVPRAASARAGGRTWAYTFEWPTPVSGAATHCIDIPFFFDVLDAPGVQEALGADPPQRLATAMHDELVRFVRTGDADWPRAAGLPGESSREYGLDGSTLVTGAYDPVLGGF